MEFFDEINDSKSLFLLEIEEPRDNQVLIKIQETTISDTEEYIPVDSKLLGPARRVIVNEKCKKFSIFFNSYVAYTIINESFPLWHDYEEWNGTLFRIYSKSNYLDYIRKDTRAQEFFDYHDKELKHFSINCANHVIHVITVEEPIIKKI